MIQEEHSAPTATTSAASPAADSALLSEHGDGRSNLLPFPGSLTGKHPYSILVHKTTEPRSQFQTSSYQEFKVTFPKNTRGSRTTHLGSLPPERPYHKCLICQRCKRKWFCWNSTLSAVPPAALVWKHPSPA